MIKSPILRISIIIIIGAVLWVATVYFAQDGMIYFPRKYYPKASWFEQVDAVNYQSREKPQTAFLYPMNRDTTPKVVWWMFGGNGMTAMDWLSMVQGTAENEDCMFVLVDYPSYGRCHGKPCPGSIYESVSDLHSTLAKRWEITPKELSVRSKAFGHSLGAAVALHTAAEYEMSEVIAVSPFTTMEAMARRKVGFLSFLLKHPFDNKTSVTRLTQQESPPKIHIFHGARDSLIPLSMGREIADLAGDRLAGFHSVKGRGHNDVISAIEDDLLKLMIASGNK